MKRHDASAIAKSDVVEAQFVGASPLGTAHRLVEVPQPSGGLARRVITSEHHSIALLGRLEGGEYQAYLLAWSGRTDPDGNAYIFHKCKAPQDYPGYCNPEADRLLDEARAVADLSARKAIYEKLTRIILDDVPKLYIYHRRVLIAHTARLEGYKQMPDGLVRVVGLKLK